MLKNKKYNFIVVGSGAGGATLAKELSNKGKTVLIGTLFVSMMRIN